MLAHFLLLRLYYEEEQAVRGTYSLPIAVFRKDRFWLVSSTSFFTSSTFSSIHCFLSKYTRQSPTNDHWLSTKNCFLQSLIPNSPVVNRLRFDWEFSDLPRLSPLWPLREWAKWRETFSCGVVVLTQALVRALCPNPPAIYEKNERGSVNCGVKWGQNNAIIITNLL